MFENHNLPLLNLFTRKIPGQVQYPLQHLNCMVYASTLWYMQFRDDEVIRRLKQTQSADGPSKRHSAIIDEEDFNRAYSTISDDKPE